MKRKSLDLAAVIAGILLLGAGLALLKLLPGGEGVQMPLPYVCIGLGCAIFGHGMGAILSRRALKNSPQLQKQREIDERDERNITISSRAKAKAYDVMIFLFGALMVAFALMGVELAAVLLLVFAYLVVVGYGIYSRIKLEKEM